MTPVRSLCLAATLLAVAILLTCPPPVEAGQQSAAADTCSVSPGAATRRLTGLVADAQGARVPRATVTLECPPFRQQTQATLGGRAFSIRLPAGTFRLRVESAGFDPFRGIVVVSPDRDAEIEVTLTVASLADAVTVHAPAVVATRATGGTKTDTPLLETPQSVSVVTRALMDERGVTTLNEALGYTAGVRPEAFGATFGIWPTRPTCRARPVVTTAPAARPTRR
jgi:iron complex outermembrane recepter protein